MVLGQSREPRRDLQFAEPAQEAEIFDGRAETPRVFTEGLFEPVTFGILVVNVPVGRVRLAGARFVGEHDVFRAGDQSAIISQKGDHARERRVPVEVPLRVALEQFGVDGAVGLKDAFGAVARRRGRLRARFLVVERKAQVMLPQFAQQFERHGRIFAAADRYQVDARYGECFAARLRRRETALIVKVDEAAEIRFDAVAVKKLAEAAEPQALPPERGIGVEVPAPQRETRRAGAFPVADRLRQPERKHDRPRRRAVDGVENRQVIGFHARDGTEFAQPFDGEAPRQDDIPVFAGDIVSVVRKYGVFRPETEELFVIRLLFFHTGNCIRTGAILQGRAASGAAPRA
ncbi:MAG: hypothetical protein BWY37_00362 [Firmicutes bacterium ADurb.Bin262]|nr:MAG: hypothetical protein BWY37_00362 [Firmicutes bacterium ADurb.Bin262]